jgi:C-lobe and N-lobe beta barrels of Tf-binding protein B
MFKVRLISLGVTVTALAACGGGGTDGGQGPQTLAVPANQSLVNPSLAQTFATYSASQQLVVRTDENGNPSELYNGEQPVGPSTEVEITYDPRDATYNLRVNSAAISQDTRFQDPAHRTTIANAQQGTPNLPNTQYYEAGSLGDVKTLFFETPGTRTRYVTFAGFLRNFDSDVQAGGGDGTNRTQNFDRSTFVYGIGTDPSQIPRTGSATYTGGLFAWMIENSTLDHISGTTTSTANFETGNITTEFSGTRNLGGTFAATGSATLASPSSNFVGSILTSSLNGVTINQAASTLEGQFFGPNVAEIGGAFRIVGAAPNTRIDVLGSFTGVKP